MEPARNGGRPRRRCAARSWLGLKPAGYWPADRAHAALHQGLVVHRGLDHAGGVADLIRAHLRENALARPEQCGAGFSNTEQAQ